MKTKIVRIGNSQGIRLPKLILNQIGAGSEVDLEVDNDRIIIKPTNKIRDGWADAFRQMALNSDDKLVDKETTYTSCTWDEEEWVW